MKKNYLTNAFSIQMLKDINSTVNFKEIGRHDIPSDVVSAIGHKDTASVLGVAENRIDVKLDKGDVVYVAQLMGGRLPEGATTLPEGFSFRYLRVTVLDE